MKKFFLIGYLILMLLLLAIFINKVHAGTLPDDWVSPSGHLREQGDYECTQSQPYNEWNDGFDSYEDFQMNNMYNECYPVQIYFYTYEEWVSGEMYDDAMDWSQQGFATPNTPPIVKELDTFYCYRSACKQVCQGMYPSVYKIFCAPLQGYEQECSEANPDSDGDGIPDAIDPFPDDDSGFIWQIVGWQKDENGKITYMTVRICRNGNCVFKVFGDYDPNQPVTIEPNPETHDGSDFMSWFGGDYGDLDPGGDPGSGGVDTGTGSHDLPFDEGTDNSGNATETEYLEDIVSNTQKTVDNQGQIGTYLSDISKRLEEQNEMIAKGIGEGGSGDINVDVDTSGVEEKLDEVKDALDNSGFDSAVTDAENFDVESHLTGGEDGMTGDIPEGSVEEPGELDEESWFESFINNNPFKQALLNSGVEVSNPVCTMNLTTSLGSWDMDLCGIGAALGEAGTILMQISALFGIILIVRG